MERLALLLAVLAAVRAEFPTKEFVEMLKPVILKCEEKTGVNKDFVDQFNKGTMVDDPTFKCYLKCMFLEFEVLDPTSGHFRYEKMLGILPQEMKPIAMEMGKNCIHFKGEEGSDLCEVSYQLHQCWQKASPQHYFLLRR
ncbi:hypothetical protein JYU34_018793 [Plutella xylostella]|uniref:Uncharacterized protein n=2 Tax=Plutella xylostella TaxID=51655 RepID=A0ABQ7PYI4_PLUXY|nr:general odorant-binding protein 83a [Plutella xylostella]KAG7298032.1 hypothetical protein JYU34_018793 [Plutella xylostella]CAG9134051.1 unnamed protein product [Plutella xylostella]